VLGYFIWDVYIVICICNPLTHRTTFEFRCDRESDSNWLPETHIESYEWIFVIDKFILSMNLWIKISVMGYIAYRYDWIGDDDVVHYCVEPLDHTYTHTNMDCTWKWVKSQIFEIYLKLYFWIQNSFGIRIEAFENKSYFE
jgi:hypothetical protein